MRNEWFPHSWPEISRLLLDGFSTLLAVASAMSLTKLLGQRRRPLTT